MTNLIASIGVLAVALVAIGMLSGCSVNGRPMRFNPGGGATGAAAKANSWFIEGKTTNGVPVSCSFVEFDERGDFLDFAQHKDCQDRLSQLVDSGRVLLVMYCHGWKNNSQSGDVVKFNSFLAKLADSEEIRKRGLRVHGVYLGWRGNRFKPYVDKNRNNTSYHETEKVFGEAIVHRHYHRRFKWPRGAFENLTYWNRKAAAEFKVSGLPMARAIFTYAAAAKAYGKIMDNRVFVIGHSFGALMLEQSLGQAMTGALTMEWWEGSEAMKVSDKPAVPFDLVLFVNSAAPAIYAKQTRDFLKAHRSARGRGRNPAQDMPVILSITSTSDKATRILHSIGNWLAPVAPSLKRRYTTGIFGDGQGGKYPTHREIRQSAFYTKTPGHHPYLVNHWIIKKDAALLPSDPGSATVLSANLAPSKEPDLFFTSKARHPPAAWELTTKPQGKPVTLDGLSPSMADANYWIISCGDELIADHNDVWSLTAMEMYAALYRAAESRRDSRR